MNKLLKKPIKTILLITILFGGTSSLASAQIKIITGGAVGAGGEPEAGKILSARGTSKFYWDGKDPLEIGTSSSHPRIQSHSKVVFYKIANNGYIDIEAGTVYEYSDLAAKENIQLLSLNEESPLDKVKKLNGVSYNWKNSLVKEKQSGFIAQDVEKIMPELVSTNDSTGGKMMSYTHMIPYLVEAIKEQQVIIEKLNGQVRNLLNIKVEGKEEDVVPVKQKVGQ